MQINVPGNKVTSSFYVEVQGHQNINHSVFLEQMAVLLIVKKMLLTHIIFLCTFFPWLHYHQLCEPGNR